MIFAPGTNVTLSGGPGVVSIYYNPATFGTQDMIYSGGTTPIQYMLVNELGHSTDSSTTTNTRSLATLSNSPNYWGENFALSADIDASATNSWNGGNGFSPIGNSTTDFSGQFDGQGHVISNLSMTSSTDNIGLFGVSSGTIQNVGLNSVLVNGGNNVGGLVGFNQGNVINSYITGSVTGTGNNVGGLVGWNEGNVSGSYASGMVNGSGNNIGGLVGVNDTGAIMDSYSTEIVTGAGNVGGLVGVNLGNVQNSFWDTDTSGQSNAFGINSGSSNQVLGGCFGGNCTNGGTVNLTSPATFMTAGWDFNNTWGIIPGQSYPYLLAFYPTTPRAISGQIAQFTGYYSNPAWASMPQNEMNPLWSSLTPVALSGQVVDLIANGTVLDSTTTGANGAYYFLEKNNANSR